MHTSRLHLHACRLNRSVPLFWWRFPLSLPRSGFRVTCRYNSEDEEDSFPRNSRFRTTSGSYGTRKGKGKGSSWGASHVTISQRSLSELALPAAGLLVAGLVVGPLLGGLVAAALGVGVAVAAAATALAFSWAILPLLLGGSLLFGGAMTAGVFATVAGSLLIFNVMKLGILGMAVWLGAKFAQSYFDNGKDGDYESDRPKPSYKDTIDVEANSIDDDFFKEQRRKESELREFDELIRQREAFKQGSSNKKGF